MKLHIGTSGYAYKEWKGSFYPNTLKASGYLSYYARHFRAVEINNTFYRMPKASVLGRWVTEVPDDFVFVVKASRRIMHIKRLLEDDKGSLGYLYEVVAALGDKLGPIYFQTPPNMKVNVERLEAFCERLPKPEHPSAIEFRHPTWFCPEVLDVLRRHGIAWVGADTEDTDPVVERTASHGYLRLRRCDYDDAALETWARTIADTGWTDCYVFFKHEDEGTGPALAQRFGAIWDRLHA